MIKLVVFDMSGTLITGSFFANAAKLVGTREKAEAIRLRYRKNEITGKQLVELAAPLLKGLSVSEIPNIFSKMTPSEGTKEALDWLRRNKIHTVIVSVAWQNYCDFVAKQLGMDKAYGTVYEIKDGKLTGKIEKMFMEKDEVLKQLIEQLKLKAEECAVIGDSPVDIPAMKLAGLAIGFKPEPIVAKETDYNITNMTELILLIEKLNTRPEQPAKRKRK